MPNIPIDLVGRRYDKLVVLSKMEMTKSGAIWICQCDCGALVRKMTTQLRRKGRLRGGCRDCESKVRSDSSSLNTNGNCKGGKTRIYSIWKGMRARCYNPKHSMYYRYGQRGIRICDEWQLFPAFKEWSLIHGYAETLTIERINPDSNYAPDNCEWITKSENSLRSWITRRNA